MNISTVFMLSEKTIYYRTSFLHNIGKSIVLLLLLFCIVTSSSAKDLPMMNKGSITGIVLDNATQEPLPGANINVSGTTFGTSSNEQGKFSIQNVEIGTYNVVVSLLGYEQVTLTDVVVNTAKPVFLKVTLNEKKIEFQGVNVEAGYFHKTPDTPISAQVQSAEEIRRLPGGLEDVVRAISILPGVAQVQAGRNDLIVRGGSPAENLFLIDNLEVPNINHFGTQGASGGPLSFVNLDFVDATTFSTGGFGVRYGDKLSSVLTITLRDGRTDRIGGKATISATQFGANLEGPISENGSFIFSARRSYLDFIFKAAGFGFVPEYWDFLGKGTYRLSASDNLSYLGIIALDRTKFFNDTRDHIFDNSRILGTNQNQYVNGVTWKHLFSNGYTAATLGYRYNTYDYQQNDTLLSPIFISTTNEGELSLLSETVIELSKTSEVSFGGEARATTLTTRMTLPNYHTSFGQIISVSSTADTTSYKAGFFGQLSQTIEHLQVRTGVRADYCSLIATPWVFAPRLSASYYLTPDITINGSIGKYYQAPATLWVLSNNYNSLLDQIGVNQYVLGIEHLMSNDIKISLEGYVKNYVSYPASLQRPYLVMVNTGAGYGGSEEGFASFGTDSLSSIGNGNAHGIELFVQKKMSELPFYGTFSVSYNETKFYALDGVGRPGGFDQRWIVNIGGGYIMSNEWEFSAKFRYATGRPYTPFNSDGTQSSLNYNAVRVQPNHSLDIRADRRWSFETWSLITYVDIQNVYNNKPKDIPRFNTRTGKIKQDDSSIGILPSIGVSAEF